MLAGIGALCAGCGVALAAYASHGAEGAMQLRLQTAAAFAFGHGLALAALAPRVASRLAHAALVLLLVGMVVFCGGLVAATLLGVGAAVAPFGGTLLILGWLLYAAASLRG